MVGSRRKRWHVALWVFLSVVLYALPLISPFPLLDPDEGLHAAISQEMAATGDYVVPRLDGVPFHDKPILFFWCQAASLRLLGSSVQAVRLPGLFFGWLGAVTTGILAARLFGRRTGYLASVLAMTSGLPLILSQAAVHDVALVPWTNLALLGLWEAHRAAPGRSRWGWVLLAGVSLGLAALAKGLIGWAIVAVAIGSALLLTRGLSVQTCVSGGLAVLIGGLVAAPWYGLMEARSPGYLHYYIVQRHVLGYVAQGQTHGGRSLWYYLPVLIGGSLPWFGSLPLAAWDFLCGRGRNRNEAPRVVAPEWTLAWCWLVGGLLFLSLAKSKLFTYLSPVMPSVAVLIAVFCERLATGQVGGHVVRSTRTAGVAQGLATLLGLPAGLIALNWFRPEWVPAHAMAIGIAVAAGCAIPLLLTVRGRWREAYSSMALWVALAFLGTSRLVLSNVAGNFSAEGLVRWVERRPFVPPKILLVEERLGSVRFFLEGSPRPELRQIPVVYTEFDEPPDWNAVRTGTVIAVPNRVRTKFEAYVDRGLFSQSAVSHYQLYVRR